MEYFYFLLYVVHFMKHLKLKILTSIEVGIIFGFVESHITLDFFCLRLGQGRSEVKNCVKWGSLSIWSCLDEYSLNKGINFARCHLNGRIDAAKLENVQCTRQHEIILVHIVDDVVDKLKKNQIFKKGRKSLKDYFHFLNRNTLYSMITPKRKSKKRFRKEGAYWQSRNPILNSLDVQKFQMPHTARGPSIKVAGHSIGEKCFGLESEIVLLQAWVGAHVWPRLTMCI